MKFALRWMSWIGFCLAAIVTAWAQAENYPNRTITVVVPFPAGGLTDVPARGRRSVSRLSSKTAPALPARSAQPM